MAKKEDSPVKPTSRIIVAAFSLDMTQPDFLTIFLNNGAILPYGVDGLGSSGSYLIVIIHVGFILFSLLLLYI